MVRLSQTSGFQPVAEDERAQRLRHVFETVAQGCDVVTVIMSMGIQRLWKHALVRWATPLAGPVTVDLAACRARAGRRVADGC